jgi:hypothetical protein
VIVRRHRASVGNIVEKLCLGLGFVGLLVVGSIYLDGWLGAKGPAAPDSGADFANAPVALLGIHRLDLQVPVFVGTDPLHVGMLEPAERRMLTLITCYPFHYVGFAPDRLIVRAHSRAGRDAAPAVKQLI